MSLQRDINGKRKGKSPRQPRELLDARVPLVNVTEAFQESAEASVLVKKFQAVLKTLDKMGYKNPILYGGALRDAILGIDPKDLDLRLSVQPSELELPEEIEGFKIDTGDRNDHVNSLEEAARYGDAIVNCIAMDVNGTIIAHPLFLEHCKQHLWMIRDGLNPRDVKRAIKRADNIAKRTGIDWRVQGQTADASKVILSCA